jgi:hypothetical protein
MLAGLRQRQFHLTCLCFDLLSDGQPSGLAVLVTAAACGVQCSLQLSSHLLTCILASCCCLRGCAAFAAVQHCKSHLIRSVSCLSSSSCSSSVSGTGSLISVASCASRSAELVRTAIDVPAKRCCACYTAHAPCASRMSAETGTATS